MVKFSALAVPAPTREPRATAAPRPATAMSFFIVRDFFSFDLFAECPVGPRLAQFEVLDGEPGQMPVTRVLAATF